MTAQDDIAVIRNSLDRLRRMEESRNHSTAKTRGAIQALHRITVDIQAKSILIGKINEIADNLERINNA